jgi:hypothetical protein
MHLRLSVSATVSPHAWSCTSRAPDATRHHKRIQLESHSLPAHRSLGVVRPTMVCTPIGVRNSSAPFGISPSNTKPSCIARISIVHAECTSFRYIAHRIRGRGCKSQPVLSPCLLSVQFCFFFVTKNEQKGTVVLAGVWWTVDSFSFLFICADASLACCGYISAPLPLSH